MAKESNKMFFAVKVIAPRVGDSKVTASAMPETAGPTKARLEYADQGKSGNATHLVIGSQPNKYVHGVAGHLVAVVHHFSDDETKKCKSVAEAEQLMKKKHKAWLTDAYDWFVMTAQLEPGSGAAKPAAKSKKAAKKK